MKIKLVKVSSQNPSSNIRKKEALKSDLLIEALPNFKLIQLEQQL